MLEIPLQTSQQLVAAGLGYREFPAVRLNGRVPEIAVREQAAHYRELLHGPIHFVAEVVDGRKTYRFYGETKLAHAGPDFYNMASPRVRKSVPTLRAVTCLHLRCQATFNLLDPRAYRKDWDNLTQTRRPFDQAS